MRDRLQLGPVTNLHYAREKFGLAVYELATGIDSIKPRLRDAYLQIMVLTEADLPEDLRPDLRWIKHELTKRKTDKYVESLQDEKARAMVGGALFATIRSMRTGRAKEIADRICYVADRLDAYAHDG